MCSPRIVAYARGSTRTQVRVRRHPPRLGEMDVLLGVPCVELEEHKELGSTGLVGSVNPKEDFFFFLMVQNNHQDNFPKQSMGIYILKS